MKGKLRLAPAVIVLALVVGGSTAAAIEWVPVPPEVKPAPWEPWFGGPLRYTPAHGSSFRLKIDGGFCAGEEPPTIDHVRVVERPKTKRMPFKSAVITVFKYRPGREQGRQTEEEIRKGKGALLGCAGIGGELRDVVKLKRSLDHLFLYDGSYSPPKRVWPPE